MAAAATEGFDPYDEGPAPTMAATTWNRILGVAAMLCNASEGALEALDELLDGDIDMDELRGWSMFTRGRSAPHGPRITHMRAGGSTFVPDSQGRGISYATNAGHPRGTLLHCAVQGSNIQAVRKLLSHGWDAAARARMPKKPTTSTTTGVAESYVLDETLRAEIIALLVEAGATPPVAGNA